MINFVGTPQRSGDWTAFKALLLTKPLKIQYEQDNVQYLIYGYDLPEVVTAVIWLGTVPSGGDQTQNDIDKADFEANYKPYANRSVNNAPALPIAAPLKFGSSSNLSVDGSVTPVVFEYNPPTGYNIELTAISFLFETTSTVVFGNKFVSNVIGTLANGLLLECKAFDQTMSWKPFQRTRDLVEVASDYNINTGTTAFMRVKVVVPPNLRLSRAGSFAQPDFLRVTVRDSLVSFAFAECYFQGVKQ